jgi:imidazolonepropionase-like amidohydrolase
VTLLRLAAVSVLILASVTGCKARPAPSTISHVVNLSTYGLTLGDERATTTIDGRRETTTIHTAFSRAPGLTLDATLVIDRGRPISLKVNGESPAFLPSSIDVAVTGDRTDTFPIRSPFPVHALAALVGQSVVSGRRQFQALPEGTITVASCAAARMPYADATCHEVTGVTWGVAHVWLDTRRTLAAAVLPTPWGLVLATTPERDDSHRALLEHFARSRASRLAETVPPVDSAQRQPIVFEHVRVLDPRNHVVPDATVIVTGDRITSVSPAEDVDIPRPSRVIDGRGLSLLPGLWDRHAHLKQPEWGPAYLAAGVTSARDLGNEESYVLALREWAARGPFPSLRLAAFIDAHASVPYTATQANSPDQARRLVRHFKEVGFDQIKVWNNVTREVLPHLVDEAHRLGLKVTGHVPNGMTAFEAIDAGMDEINHIGSLMDAADNDANSANGRRLIARLLERKVIVDPTLVVAEFGNRSTAVPVSTFEPGFAKAPRPVQDAWSAIGQPPDRASDAPLQRAMAFVRALHSAGVPIVAGSDQGVPGHTLHREIELYVRAGLTPLEAIATATTDRIAAGSPADLILVDGRPDENIAALRNVRYVMKKGALYDPAALWRSVGFQP